ncbi:MAG TPA: BatD family protein [Terriglobia bacterium]|nr:BatD family protein [Terriglobia bacterium]
MLLCVNPALSQDTKAQLKTSVDATTVTIGDVVTVKLSVKHPETLKIAFPPVGTSLGEWTVRSSKPLAPTKLADGSVEDTLELQLAAYKTGDFEIPALNVETVKTSGEKEVFASEPIKIAVQSVLTGNQDTLKDLKPQAEIEADYKPFLFLLAALASAAYLVYRLVQYFKRRKRAPIPKPGRVRSAEEIAREAIERLLARKLVEQGHLKQFYLELSEIIKRFLGSKLGVHSLERTTEEFTRDLRAVSVPSAEYRMIREFLEDCDLVKFAKYRPGAEEVEQIIARARAMIDGMTEVCVKPLEVGVTR